ncbi:MAG: citrate/2-methylcitrate synthase, partial [Gammaproteobacteria bacterium]
MSSKIYKLTGPDNKTSELPLREGSLGPATLDIGGLYKDQGIFTFDPGFVSTSSCESKITYIDGDQGILLYRGYPVDQLAAKSNFLEVCYLILYGELPNELQRDTFVNTIRHHSLVNEAILRFFNGFHYDAHPMAMMTAVVGSLSAFYHDSTDIHNPRHREVFAHRIIAKMPTLAAGVYKHGIGQPFVYPRNDLDYCANFLHMLFSVPAEQYQVDPVAAEALDLLFILHADHEQNAST